MTVWQICRAVRWCFDEEEWNASSFEGLDNDQRLMDNIIIAKIGDALRWVCMQAPSELLTGASSGGSVDIDCISESTNETATNGRLTLSSKFLRLIRVKGARWHRAIMHESLIREDSDEYLQLRDEHGATATVDRPQAALINTKTKKLEVWPSTYMNGTYETDDTFEVTYVVMPTMNNISSSSTVNVPPMVETSFIYYIAYLVLLGYGDARAPRMLEVAFMNIGKHDDKQRQ